MRRPGIREPNGTRYFPVADEPLARRAFGLRLTLLMLLIEELDLDLRERQDGCEITDREAEPLTLALELTQEEGVIERPVAYVTAV
jgi:hypothetical protein